MVLYRTFSATWVAVPTYLLLAGLARWWPRAFAREYSVEVWGHIWWTRLERFIVRSARLIDDRRKRSATW
jgi:hypothetical protein